MEGKNQFWKEKCCRLVLSNEKTWVHLPFCIYSQKSTKTLYVCVINNTGERKRERSRNKTSSGLQNWLQVLLHAHSKSSKMILPQVLTHSYFNLAEDYKHVLNFSFHFFWFRRISFQIFFLYLLPCSHVLTV